MKANFIMHVFYLIKKKQNKNEIKKTFKRATN